MKLQMNGPARAAVIFLSLISMTGAFADDAPSFQPGDYVKNRDADSYSKLQAQKTQCMSSQMTEDSPSNPKMSAFYDAIATVMSDKRCKAFSGSAVKQEGRTRGATNPCSITLPSDLVGIGFGTIHLDTADGAGVNIRWDGNHIANMSIDDWLYGKDAQKGLFTQLSDQGACSAEASGCRYVVDAGAPGLFSEIKTFKPSMAVFNESHGKCSDQLTQMHASAAEFPSHVCSGFVSCKPGQYDFATCESSGPSSCPTADQCLNVQKTSANPDRLEFSKPQTDGKFARAIVHKSGSNKNICFVDKTGATGGQVPGGAAASLKDSCDWSDVAADDCYVMLPKNNLTVSPYPGTQSGSGGGAESTGGQ